jgi:RNA polymerase sigma-70 factor (ECF subfamily)
MEDSHIVELYWARSETAIAETASKYGKYCRSIAYSILNNSEDADECVNDALMGAWNSMPPHRPSVLSAFLGKITRRMSINRWQEKYAAKRGGGEVVLVLDELFDCIPSDKTISSELEEKELSKIIDAFLDRLPLVEQKVFICRYWYMNSISEISKQFGFSECKTKSMLYRTRGKLTSALRKEGYLNEI